MELREGYKKTEVGIIPNEWTPKTYGELFQFLTTSSFSRDELSEEGDVRCVHYGDIHTKYHQFLDFSNGFNSFIDLERGKKYPFVKDGDIIMADASEDYSGIGKSVEVKNLGDKLAISGLHTFLLRDKNGDFEDGFKAYIHSMAPVKKSMDRLATGLKVYGVSKANLKTVLVPVPPPAEQQAIATALSDVDALITNLDKLIAKKKAIKQGAMQRLLKSPAQGGQRLPGFEGEWVEHSLTDLCWFQEGPGLRNWQFANKGMKVINVTNLVNGYLDLDRTSRHISIEEFENMYRHFEIDEGDIVVASSGNSYCKTAVVRKCDLPLVMNTSVIRFKPKSLMNYDMLLVYLKSDLFKKQVDLLITGGAQPNFGPAHLEKIKLILPSPEEQKAIAGILTDMDKEIESIESKKSKYLRIKQGMMKELLSGKTRLV